MSLRYSDLMPSIVNETWKGSLPEGVSHVGYMYSGFDDTVVVIAYPSRPQGRYGYCYIHPAKLIDSYDARHFLEQVDEAIEGSVCACWFDSSYPASME